VAAGPDGAIWAADGVKVSRFDGRSWLSYGPSDGLPSATWVVVAKGGVYVTTGEGIFRLANGERWERAWPLTSPKSPATPRTLTLLVAASRDELWAREGQPGTASYWEQGPSGVQGRSGLWHLQDGTWTSELIGPGPATDAPDVMAYAPDGTLWAAGQGGVAYRRDGRWTVVDSGRQPQGIDGARAIAFDSRGTVWIAGWEVTGWLVSSSRLWTLRPDGTSWVSQAIGGYPFDPESLAIDRTGVVWAGSPTAGLARFDGQGWTTIREAGGSPISGATVLGVAPDGAVWVAASYSTNASANASSQGESSTFRAARFDGKAWTVLDLPSDYVGNGSRGDLALAPDGTLWASTYRGPAHYDGRTWSFPYADRIPTAVSWGSPSYTVARDGTVFGQTPTGIVRFPAAGKQP
jgi:ligand-binding sensor domain-containing protein